MVLVGRHGLGGAGGDGGGGSKYLLLLVVRWWGFRGTNGGGFVEEGLGGGYGLGFFEDGVIGGRHGRTDLMGVCFGVVFVLL